MATVTIDGLRRVVADGELDRAAAEYRPVALEIGLINPSQHPAAELQLTSVGVGLATERFWVFP